MRLEDWLNYWTPGMQRDGGKVAVFPSPDGDAVVLKPDELASMLRAEDEAWYGGG